FELEWIENPKEPISYRIVDRMVLDKARGTIEVNSSLSLAGIPREAFDYVLGTRSALEWLVDQYRVEEDSRSGSSTDPNNPEDERYVVRLIERVTAVSLETMKLINALPPQLTFVGLDLAKGEKAIQ